MHSPQHSKETLLKTPAGSLQHLDSQRSTNYSADQPVQSFEYFQQHDDDQIIESNNLYPEFPSKRATLKHQYTLLKIKPCSGEYDENGPNFNKGWFKIYQIWLALSIVSLVVYGFYSLIHSVNTSQSINLRFLAFAFYLFFFVIMELQAILQKDLNKASCAIWGFKGFMIAFFIIQLIFVISYPKSSLEYFAQLVLGLASFYISVFMGATHVLISLKNA